MIADDLELADDHHFCCFKPLSITQKCCLFQLQCLYA